VQRSVKFEMLQVLDELAAELAIQARMVVHVALVTFQVDFQFASERASLNLAPEPSLPSQIMHQHVNLQLAHLAAHFSTLVAREFLHFVLLRMLPKFTRRRKTLIAAVFVDALEHSRRRSLVLFQVSIQVVEGDASGAAKLTHQNLFVSRFFVDRD